MPSLPANGDIKFVHKNIKLQYSPATDSNCRTPCLRQYIEMSYVDVVKYNMEDLRLDLMDVENRAEWRRRTCVADPSPEGFNPA